MLSVLIPIYNCDVRALVHDLHQQARNLPIDWEIRLLDDGSQPRFHALHQPLAALPGVHYQALPQNVGRARIRNLLAEAAQYPYLLFMDGDSGVLSDDYLSHYAARLAPGQLICGGRVYAPAPPTDATYLHWYYGTHRECQPATVRNRRPHFGFQTNNFVLPKAVWEAFPFDEALRQYGHEDTLMGVLLERAGVPILHIDNPLRHLELQDANTWWDKQEWAMKNLFHLYQTQGVTTRAVDLWERLHRWGVMRLVYPSLRAFMPQWKTHLQHERPPSLFYLDAWKLLRLEELWRGSE